MSLEKNIRKGLPGGKIDRQLTTGRNRNEKDQFVQKLVCEK